MSVPPTVPTSATDSASPSASSSPLRVAVTGAEGFFGRALVQQLAQTPGIERVLAVGATRGAEASEGPVVAEKLDLVHPRSAERLAAQLDAHRIDVLVHTAFLARPVHHGAWAHELEAVGTRHVLAALEGSPVRRLVLRSTTLVYGARPGANHALAESSPLEGGSQGAFLRDKIGAEEQVVRFSQRHPGKSTVILRLAPLLGPRADTLATSLLRRSTVPLRLGYDPLVQVLHQDDALEATIRAIRSSVTGAINIAAPGVLPLSEAIRLAGGTPVPLPWVALATLAETLWTARVGHFPPGLTAFLRYSCVGSIDQMRSALGFEPRYDIRRALAAFAWSLRRGDAPAPAAPGLTP